jgi:hypothetical protein
MDPRDKFKEILGCLPLPEIVVAQDLIDKRIAKNLEILKKHNIKDSDQIQHFIDSVYCHDVVVGVSKTLSKQAPNGVINFSVMHDPTIWGKFTKDWAGNGLGWYLGTIIGAGDFVINTVVDGAFDPIYYHQPDFACLEKLVKSDFVKKASADQIYRDLTTAITANIVKNITRPVAALVTGKTTQNSEGLVNTDNLQSSAVGIVDNLLDSFAPLIVQPIREWLRSKQLAPIYSASLLLREDLDAVILRTKATWFEAFKNGLIQTPQKIFKKFYDQISPFKNLLPNMMSICCIGMMVANVVNSNGAIKEASREAFVKNNPSSPSIVDGKLIKDLVPLSGWIESRFNSVFSFAGLNMLANTMYLCTDHVVDGWMKNLFKFRSAGGGDVEMGGSKGGVYTEATADELKRLVAAHDLPNGKSSTMVTDAYAITTNNFSELTKRTPRKTNRPASR